jgi:hypothetical protein
MSDPFAPVALTLIGALGVFLMVTLGPTEEREWRPGRLHRLRRRFYSERRWLAYLNRRFEAQQAEERAKRASKADAEQWARDVFPDYDQVMKAAKSARDETAARARRQAPRVGTIPQAPVLRNFDDDVRDLERRMSEAVDRAEEVERRILHPEIGMEVRITEDDLRLAIKGCPCGFCMEVRGEKEDASAYRQVKHGSARMRRGM